MGKNSSLMRTISWVFVFVFTITAGLALAATAQGLRIMRLEVLQSYQNTVNSLVRAAEDRLERLKAVASALAVDARIHAINQTPEWKTQVWEYRSLQEELRLLSLSSAYENNISIWMLNRKRMLSTQSGLSTINPQDAPKIDIGKWSYHRDQEILRYIADNTYAESQKGVAISLDLAKAEIARLLDELNFKGGTLFLSDQEGVCVVSQGARFNADEVTALLTENGDTGRSYVVHKDGEAFRVLAVSLVKSDLRIGTIYSESDLMQPVRSIQIMLYFAAGFLLLMGVVFIYAVRRSLLRPFSDLIEGMSRVREGDYAVRIVYIGKFAELYAVSDQFNRMVEQIDTLINQVYDGNLRYQQAQLKFLQSQINPHFLYNSLNFIYQMAMAENQEATTQMALYLSRYFRYAMQSNHDEITLSEELESIDAYVHIQMLRFSKQIEFSMMFDEEILRVRLPRLIIQPAVENALVHGFPMNQNPGELRLQGAIIDGYAQVVVEDTGVGIDPLKLEALNQALDRGEGGDGLLNPNRRLKLLHGNCAGITLSCIVPSGTRVRIVFPVKRDDMGKGGALDA